VERVPRSATLQRHFSRAAAIAALLAGGDDYELCFTAAKRQRERIERLARSLRLTLTRIGTIVPRHRRGQPVTVLAKNGRALKIASRGFDHFA